MNQEEEFNEINIRKNVQIFLSMVLNHVVEEDCRKNEQIAHGTLATVADATFSPTNDTANRQYIEGKVYRQNEDSTDVKCVPYVWKRSISMPLLSTFGFNNATKNCNSCDFRTDSDIPTQQAQPDLDNDSVSQVRCHVNDDVACISYNDYKSLSLAQALELPPMMEVDLTPCGIGNSSVDVAALDRMIDEAGEVAYGNSKIHHQYEADAKHKPRDMEKEKKNKQKKKGFFSRVGKFFRRMCCCSVQEEECADNTLDTLDEPLILIVDTYL